MARRLLSLALQVLSCIKHLQKIELKDNTRKFTNISQSFSPLESWRKTTKMNVETTPQKRFPTEETQLQRYIDKNLSYWQNGTLTNLNTCATLFC